VRQRRLVWCNFCQLQNIHRVSDVRQIEIHTAEPLVPDPSPFEVEIPGGDQIAAVLAQAESETFQSEVH
jgi:hypothetical protein